MVGVRAVAVGWEMGFEWDGNGDADVGDDLTRDRLWYSCESLRGTPFGLSFGIPTRTFHPTRGHHSKTSSQLATPHPRTSLFVSTSSMYPVKLTNDDGLSLHRRPAGCHGRDLTRSTEEVIVQRGRVGSFAESRTSVGGSGGGG
jgi:hypothetical protein